MQACAPDVRNPFEPKEIGYYIPAISDKTDKRCVGAKAPDEKCKIAIQTNNVDIDERGYIIHRRPQRQHGNAHYLQLTGEARKAMNLP